MIQAICWVLVHSLWQGVLLALAGGGVVLATKRSAAAVRYRLLCGLMGLFLVGLGLSFGYEWAMVSGNGEKGAGTGGVSMNWLGAWCSEHADYVVTVWLLVVVGKSIRMAAGWSYIRRMRREGLAAPALWVEKVDALSRELGIRRTVKLVESALVRVPVVIGQLRPIIYVPLGLINHLPAGEMEAVLLHELAHIRRYDHIVNMVQQAAECVLFFNLGFLWISSLLREERENCCDDVAIAHTRERLEFVRALVRFSEHSMKGMALAFPGNKRQLLHRVLRIARQENKTLNGKERLLLLVGCVALMCVFAARVGRPDGGQSKEQLAMKVEERGVKAVQPELVTVLRTRQHVTKNMKWVQAQLDQLHHKSNGKKQKDKLKDMIITEEVAKNAEQVRQNEELVRQEEDRVRNNEEQVRQQEEQVRQKEELVNRNDEQVKANQDRIQRDEQAERDRQQAIRDREQAERDRLQAELDRQQAVRDREQADRDREQANRDREQAVKEHAQGERDRAEGERQRLQAEMERRQMELNRLKELTDRMKVAQDRMKVERDRQQEGQH